MEWTPPPARVSEEAGKGEVVERRVLTIGGIRCAKVEFLKRTT
jgi:hypothetical protein